MPDTVLALVQRSRLSVVLTAFHREGYGHVTRVLDPERSPLTAQLLRAGVDRSRLAAARTDDSVLLFVHAPMRTTIAAALAVSHGAHDVEVVTCAKMTAGAVVPGMMTRSRTRRDRRSDATGPVVPSDGDNARPETEAYPGGVH